MSEEKIKDLLKYRFNIVPVYLSTQNIQEGVPQLINKELALKHVLIPFKQSSFRLLVAMADPFNTEAIEQIQKGTGLTVLPRKAEANEILKMIELFYGDELATDTETKEIEENIEKETEDTEENIEKEVINEQAEESVDGEEREVAIEAKVEKETEDTEENIEIEVINEQAEENTKSEEAEVAIEANEEVAREEKELIKEENEEEKSFEETKKNVKAPAEPIIESDEKNHVIIMPAPSFKEKLLGRGRRDSLKPQASQQKEKLVITKETVEKNVEKVEPKEKAPEETKPKALELDVREQLEDIKDEINKALMQEKTPIQEKEDLLTNVFGRKDEKRDSTKNGHLAMAGKAQKGNEKEKAENKQIQPKNGEFKEIQNAAAESQERLDNKTKIGTLLLENELIQEQQLNSAIKIQKRTKQKLGEILVDHQMVDEEDFVRTLSKQTGIPLINLNEVYINPEIPTLIKESLARKYLLVPMRIEKGQLHVAMADPLNVYAIDDVKIATGFAIVPYIAGKKDIIRAIDQYYGQLSTEEAVEDLMKELDTEVEETSEKEILSTINNAPLVRLVNSLLRQAVTMKASDVHIEPFEGMVRVRFRIDGDLQEIMNLDINTHPAVVARIKIMGKMDIAEKRVPQDGRVEIRVEDRKIDLRLSTLPTAFGEKVVIRILDKEGASFNRKKLGFSKEALDRLDTIIHNSCGIILVTGPTGSGKSSTLYTILTELNKVNRNIITVEDPIEYRMVGVNQVQVNHKAGLDFASGLRSILRQDPDIIMVGEIRDSETVQIAVRAAITGHLVLSTIHTNDTASTISRLVDMGVEPYLISSSLVGIIAQRLVKKICPDCKTEYHPNAFEKSALGLADSDITYKGKGCANCNNTGYKGRTAIAEIMDISFEIKKMINERKSTEDIKTLAAKKGMITLQDSCKKLVMEGITTVDEYFRNAYVVE